MSDRAGLGSVERRAAGQVLVFDADDTLWENNVLFERVIDDFFDWLDHPTLDRREIRRILDDIERANTVVHGYGSRVFLHSLGECLERLRERPATARERREIEELAVALVERRVELIPGVADTLTILAGRYDLLLLTKGDGDEQRRKLDASGLGHHFRAAPSSPTTTPGCWNTMNSIRPTRVCCGCRPFPTCCATSESPGILPVVRQTFRRRRVKRPAG